MRNNYTEFRGLQREVLEVIITRKSPIIDIIDIGVGKTILFILPTIMNPRGIIIIVVPLISL